MPGIGSVNREIDVQISEIRDPKFELRCSSRTLSASLEDQGHKMHTFKLITFCRISSDKVKRY